MSDTLTAQPRAVRIYKALMDGPKRVSELRELVGMSERGVYRILENITCETTLTNSGGYWYLLTTDEQRTLHHIVAQMERELASARTGQAFAHSMKIADVTALHTILRRFLYTPEPD